jgi:hypothetical protein
MLVNIVAQVPLTTLNAMGRADVTAKIAAAELPVYVAAIWYAASRFGVVGVAGVWAVRAAIDAMLLLAAAHVLLPRAMDSDKPAGLNPATMAVLILFLAAFWAAGLLLREQMFMRAVSSAGLFAALLVWIWRGLLTPGDRKSLKTLWVGITGRGFP